jgi:hypothetical protein
MIGYVILKPRNVNMIEQPLQERVGHRARLLRQSNDGRALIMFDDGYSYWISRLDIQGCAMVGDNPAPSRLFDPNLDNPSPPRIVVPPTPDLNIVSEHKFIQYPLFDEERLKSLMGQEVIYDTHNDRIGDCIGASALLEYFANKYKVKISVIVDKNDPRHEYSWFKGIDIFEWTSFKPYKIYEPSIVDDTTAAIIFDSRARFYGDAFHIWALLKKFELYPKMSVPKRLLETFEKPEGKFASLHVLNIAGVRSGEYVNNRKMSMEKYERIALELCNKGWKVNRLGIAYDAIRPFKEPVIDYTSQNLPLEQTFLRLSYSSLFLGGDTGLKHAASAFGIPMIIETNEYNIKHILQGRPELVTLVPYNCSFEEYMNILNNHPVIKESEDVRICDPATA